MLSTDHVRARRQRGELTLTPLQPDQRARALALAEAMVATVRSLVGSPRDEVEEALDAIEAGPKDRLLGEGLRKLIDDRCEFETPPELDPEKLRREIFLRAAAHRRAAGAAVPAPPFDGAARQAVLGAVAAQEGLSEEALELGLYADLREAQRLVEVRPVFAAELVEGYDVAQAQAVLLRAVRVSAEVSCSTAAAYRVLLRKLKFLRLLVRIEPMGAAKRDPQAVQGYLLEIDGPYSLFDQVTKYGLQLALALPVLLGCDHLRLSADLRWGKQREALRFRLEGRHGALVLPEGRGPTARAPAAPPPAAPAPPPPPEGELLPDEVAQLVRGFQALGSPWDVVLAPVVLHLPGVGVCVPDLLFRNRLSGRRVFMEVMGYWSRDAVWRRVELVEKGLREPILFALSERLRVSEEALPKELPSALYVYKGVLSPKVVLERLEDLASRQPSP